MSKSWFYVAMTSFFELVWIYGFNVASEWWHWIFIIAFIMIDFHFLTLACKALPTGTVYASFAGIGTIGTAVMDVFFFGQSLNFGKILFIIVLVLGVIGLNLADVLEEKKSKEGVI